MSSGASASRRGVARSPAAVDCGGTVVGQGEPRCGWMWIALPHCPRHPRRVHTRVHTSGGSDRAAAHSLHSLSTGWSTAAVDGRITKVGERGACRPARGRYPPRGIAWKSPSTMWIGLWMQWRVTPRPCPANGAPTVREGTVPSVPQSVCGGRRSRRTPRHSRRRGGCASWRVWCGPSRTMPATWGSSRRRVCWVVRGS